jgi:hypothetical protein
MDAGAHGDGSVFTIRKGCSVVDGADATALAFVLLWLVARTRQRAKRRA